MRSSVASKYRFENGVNSPISGRNAANNLPFNPANFAGCTLREVGSRKVGQNIILHYLFIINAL
jgi:hypothetical protein